MLFATTPYDPERHRLVLVHIRKTGGTSLGRMLDRAFGNPMIEAVREGEHVRRDRGLLRAHRKLRHGLLALRRRRRVARAKRAGRPAYLAAEAPYIAGHFVLGTETPCSRAPLYLTLVRDPVDRLLSDYWFMRGKRDRSLGDAADPRLYDLGPNEFARAILAEAGLYRDNLQCRSLAGSPDLDAARQAVAGRLWLGAATEQLPEMAHLLGTAIGRDLGTALRAKANAARPAEPGVETRLLDRLRDLNAADAALVEEIRAEFAALARA